MTKQEIYHLIPKTFKVAGQEIHVDVEDLSNTDNSDHSYYGLWVDPLNTIKIYRTIDVTDFGIIELTSEQILNSFYHELFHCFLFFSGMDQDERLVQSFANFMREFDQTKECN